jgi:formamidopyrimidine-DNA glycosylase
MPELPDISACLEAWNPAFQANLWNASGSPIHSWSVQELRRVGKRIAFGLDGDLWLVLNLMIAGRLHWKRRASLHVVQGEEGFRSMDPGGIDVLHAARLSPLA